MTSGRYVFADKICENCGKSYPPAGGRQRWCESCNPLKSQFRRHRHLLRKFGITLEEYTTRLEAQHGLCAICQQPERRLGFRGQPSKMIIDHNHQTNQVRGLICHGCNTAIGHLRDDPNLAEAVATYLRQWEKGS